MYVNHSDAKMTFHTIVENGPSEWIKISGGETSGKTSFIKEVCNSDKTLICDPHNALCYLEGLLPYAQNNILEFLKKHNSYFMELSTRLGIMYIGDIKHDQYKNIAREIIRIDMAKQTYAFANYLGEIASQNFKFLVLDDIYKCDENCYDWLHFFCDCYLGAQRYVIAVCDFHKTWYSSKVHEILHDYEDLIDIQHFNSSSDYLAVLEDNIYFDDYERLRKLAQTLFNYYNGDAQRLFQTIKQYGNNQDTNDDAREKEILKFAEEKISSKIEYTNGYSKLVAQLLALSPCALTKNVLCSLTDADDRTIQNVLMNFYGQNVLRIDNREDENHYELSNSTIKEWVIQNMDMRQHDFLTTSIWKNIKSNCIPVSFNLQIEFALRIKSPESEDMLAHYIYDYAKVLTPEKKIRYLDHLYSLNLNQTNCFSNYENAKLAYEYGYYETAFKMLSYAKQQEKTDYSFLILLGDVQHLLLHPETAKTYEQAANIHNISISQKLSALNREIMSLNQAGKESAQKARALYDSVFNQYENEKCDGLIELYRNTNNSYPPQKALEYTIKGYQLANELENDLEKYKCLHNICMILLHENQYNQKIYYPKLDLEPSFDLVDDYFKKNPQYYHERAYPLLDMGTYEMFEYFITKEKQHLKKAKSYYSSAQLFAKSFYARNIAELSLLVVNTHLYRKQTQIINNLRHKRNLIYTKYLERTIEDHRVHRKILLSLTVSAILTENTEEARNYLSVVKSYISGPETARYENLCNLCDNKDVGSIDPADMYYGSPYFVPWLISFGH